MADPFKFADAPRSGPLAEAAERLDRVVNVVKDQQLARNQSGVRRPESEAFVLSPEEAWSKKYMIQCVGPVCTVRPTAEGALLLPRFAPAPPRAALPTMEIAPAAPAPAAVAPAVALVAPPPAQPALRQAGPGHIGAMLGKPPRKSFLGRLFGG
jgi:hypothetical protein